MGFWALCKAPTDQETRFSSLEAQLDALSSSFEALAHKFDVRSSARPSVSQNSDLEEDLRLAVSVCLSLVSGLSTPCAVRWKGVPG